MKETREAYKTLADRAVQLLAAVANTTSKASPEKLIGMESNVQRLIEWVTDGVAHIHPPDAIEQHASENRVDG
jgi:hypothetical protein